MAESSRFWTTSGTGDGPGGGYSAANFNEFVRHAFMTDPATEGVLRGIGGNLAVTGASSPVAVASGSALVYGFFYASDASVNVTIPTPTTSTRIDRIVLRVSWAAQTVRIVRIAGTEGGGAPALTQTANTTWDIPLAQVSITTGGVITLTDQRTYIKAPGVYQWLQAALTINGALTVNGAATATGTVSGSSLNVDGNFYSTLSGGVNPLQNFDSNDFVLFTRAANVWSWFIGGVQVMTLDGGGVLTPTSMGTNTVPSSAIVSSAVTTAKIADANVTTAKIADSNVTTAKIAADAVDDTKAGDRVPQFYRRQGGSASDWSVVGTSTQTPGAVRMQGGAIEVTVTASLGGAISVTFPAAFSNKPLVYVSIAEDIATNYIASVTAVSASSITIQVLHYEGSTLTNTVTVNWLAIGPE